MRKFLLFLLLPSTLLADGVIIPIPPRPRPKPIYLDLEYHKVKAHIEENIAQVEIDEVFSNPHSQRLEGEFIFPIPEEAVVSSFALFVGDKKVEGEVLERKEARRIYEDILRRKRDPALLEYYGQDLFRARIFPFSPGDRRKISLKYEQILKRRGEFIEFRYPLKIEGLTNSPIEEVVIDVEIRTESPIKSVFSPTHEIDVVLREENEVRVSYEKSNVKPTKDLLLYFSTSREELGFSSLMHRKDEGFFMLSLAPGLKTEGKGEEKDIVFLLDVSGSMAEERKIEGAKKALEFFLSALEEGDRFTVIPFSTDVKPWQEELVPANRDNVADAIKFIENLKAIGGTNIAGALTEALVLERTKKRPFYIAFVTDGKPTVGVTRLDEILKLVEEKLNGAKIFILGVGYSVNTHLIDKLAQISRGISEYAKPEEDLELLLSDFYSKLSHPALTEISIDYGEAGVYQAYPQALPDLFYGSQIVVIGKYRNPGLYTVVVKGMKKGKEEAFEKELSFPEKADCPFLPRLWAKRRVGYLLDEIRLHGEEKELVDEIVELGKRYGIVTPYTSFLVTEEELAKAPSVIHEKEALTRQTGVGAFKAAEELGKMKRGVIAVSEQEEVLSIKVLADKVFLLKDGVWVDSEYKEGLEERILILWSDEYMDFLKQHPEAGKYMALGGEVVFVYEGVAYRIKS